MFKGDAVRDKIIIYGLGKIFENYFVQDDFLTRKFDELDYVVEGFIDKNKNGNMLVYNGKKYQIKSLQEWIDSDIDEIIVTSSKYFDEIRDELCDYGFAAEKIVSLEKVFNSFLNKEFHIEAFENRMGIEIGGPSFIFSNIYNACNKCDDINFSAETVWWEKGNSNVYKYNGSQLGDVYIADATDMRVIDSETYDFVLSSNNLEHIANPIKALKEFYRILKKNGIAVIAVPMKTRTFDHNRNYTSFEHLMEDYRGNIGEDDLSHLPEILELHDYDMDIVCGGKENFEKRAQLNIENRCLHHHVFDEKCLRQAFEYLKLEVIQFTEILGNYVIIGKK